MKVTRTRILSLAVALAAALGCGNATAARAPDARDVQDAIVEAVSKVTPAVVHIKVATTVVPSASYGLEDFFFGPRRQVPSRPRQTQGQGSGVIVSPDGYILTNHHVAGEADRIEVTLQSGRTLPAQRIGIDPLTDLAVLKISGENLPYAQFADSDEMRIGQFVIAIGNPFGLEHTVTLGIVSARGRRGIVGTGSYEDFIQTDAAINPGNSGGPLIDLDGRIVGINSAIFTRSGGYQGIGFAIPSTLARTIQERLVKFGYVERSWLGVSIEDLTIDLAAALGVERVSGAVVSEVYPGSPAALAGLRPYDVVLSVDGRTVKDSGELRNRVAHIPAGRSIQIDVMRGSQRMRLNAALQAHPAQAAPAQARPVAPLAPEPGEGPIGLSLRPITRAEARELGLQEGVGLVVARIVPGGAAQEAGLRLNDVVLEANRQQMKSVDDFADILSKHTRGSSLLLLVRSRATTQFVVLKY